VTDFLIGNDPSPKSIFAISSEIAEPRDPQLNLTRWSDRDKYSLQWMFQGIGTRGSTGGWTGVGGCMVASLGGLLGGNGSRTGSGLARGFGMDTEEYKEGEK